jgi:hypothetical protein
MSLLVTVDAVRAYIGLIDNGIINAKIEEAIATATLQLSNFLSCPFDLVTDSDTFHLKPDVGLTNPDGSIKLRTSRMFIDDGSSISVVVASTYQGLSETPDTIDPSNYRVDVDTGIIQVYSGFTTGDFVKVSYTAGLTEIANVFQDVPEWLLASSKLMAQASYELATSQGESDQLQDELSKVESLRAEAELILSPHIRPYYSVHLPI